MRSKASLRATVLNSTTGSAFEFCCSVYKQTDQHSWLWSQQEKHIHQFSHISKLTMIATKWCLPGIRQKGINEIFIDEKHDHLSDHQRPANLGPDCYVTWQIAWFSTCDVAWSLGPSATCTLVVYQKTNKDENTRNTLQNSEVHATFSESGLKSAF